MNTQSISQTLCRTDHRSRFGLALAVGAAILVHALPAQSAPQQPVVTAPQLNQQLGNPIVTVRWQASKGAQSYIVVVREHGSSQDLVNQRVTGSSYNFDARSRRGGRFTFYVSACGVGNDCSGWSQTGAYVQGPPVSLSNPASGASYGGADRRPTFSWQAYDGFRPSSSMGNITYKLTVAGNGAPPQTFTNITSTSFQPPQAINPAFQNPVRWSVQACNSHNCSSGGGNRQLNLTGSSFTTVQGPVNLTFPANGTVVNSGSQLKWSSVPNAGNYTVCLNTQPSGCIATYQQTAQPGSTQTFTLTQQILDAKPPVGQPYFRGKTVYWSVNACTTGFTSCTSQNSQPQWRNVQVAAAQPGTGGGGTTPQVSFAQHLYPTIASSTCASCHTTNNFYPQKKPSNAASCGVNVEPAIPFNTSVSASTMLNRFKCMKATSTQGPYHQALNKVYVVPGSSNNSGLHWKAQASTAAPFSANVTIGGVTKPLKEWIKIWIDQGANP